MEAHSKILGAGIAELQREKGTPIIDFVLCVAANTSSKARIFSTQDVITLLLGKTLLGFCIFTLRVLKCDNKHYYCSPNLSLAVRVLVPRQ